jgi:hypothetical protein
VATPDARLSLALQLVRAAGLHALAGAEQCQVEWKDEGERVTMNLMTGYEFVDVPVEIELCPRCKQTRLMRVGTRMVCGKDGSKHDRGIRYQRMAEEGPGEEPLKGVGRDPIRVVPRCP